MNKDKTIYKLLRDKINPNKVKQRMEVRIPWVMNSTPNYQLDLRLSDKRCAAK